MANKESDVQLVEELRDYVILAVEEEQEILILNDLRLTLLYQVRIACHLIS